MARAGALVLVVLGCGPKRVLRTDVAPLARRLALPAGVRDVRWVALPEHEDGCVPTVPEPDARTLVYASLRLDDGAWRDLETRLPKRTPGAMTLPSDVARAILPATLSPPGSARSAVTVAGAALSGGRLASAPHVSVLSALRADELLLVELLLSP